MTTFWHRLVVLNAPFIARELRRIADQIEAAVPGPAVAGVMLFTGKGVEMSSIEVKDNDAPRTARLALVDAEGSPTTPEDVPVWASDNENAVTLEVAEDGLSAVASFGAPGAAIITATSTNDDGTTVTLQGTITVVAGEAVSGEIVFDDPAA